MGRKKHSKECKQKGKKMADTDKRHTVVTLKGVTCSPFSEVLPAAVCTEDDLKPRDNQSGTRLCSFIHVRENVLCMSCEYSNFSLGSQTTVKFSI